MEYKQGAESSPSSIERLSSVVNLYTRILPNLLDGIIKIGLFSKNGYQRGKKHIEEPQKDPKFSYWVSKKMVIMN